MAKKKGGKIELVMDQGTKMILYYRQHPCQAAYDLLGVDLAPVQRLMFRDMWFKNYLIGICGRGVGKSSHINSLSFIEDKGLCYLHEEFEPIPSFLRSGDTIEVDSDKSMYTSNGFRSVKKVSLERNISGLKLITKYGFEHKGSYHHPLLTIDEDLNFYYKQLQDFKPGDRVCIQRGQNVFGNNDMPEEDARLIGQEVRDGSTSLVPYSIRTATRKSQIAFLQGYFGTDEISGTGRDVYSVSKKPLHEIQIMLLNFGIISRIRKGETDSKFGKVFIIETTSYGQDETFDMVILSRLKHISDTNYYFDCVELTEEWSGDCYDFEMDMGNIDTEPNYFCNGFINHNTFMLGTLATLSCMLYPGHRVGLIGPVFRQSKMIFSEVEKLYAQSSIFREACEKRPIRGTDTCYVKFKSVGGIPPAFIESLPLSDGCLTACNYLTFHDRFGKISDAHDESIDNNHCINRQETVWGNGKFRESDKSLCNGVKDTIKIKTKKGFKNEGTYNHMFKVVRAGETVWCRFDEMVVGDNILIDRSYRWHEGNECVTKEQAYALGAMIGDGSWTNKYYLRYTTVDNGLIKFVREGTGLAFASEANDGVHYNHNSKQDRQVWLDFWDMCVCYTKDKYLPDKMLNTSREIMSSCLSGIFDTDGTLQMQTSKGGVAITVSLTNTSEKLIDQIHYILLHYGIVATKTERSRTEGWNTTYDLLITGSDVKIFYEQIGFKLKRKNEILETAIRNKTRWVKNDNIPGIRQDMIRVSEKNRVKKGSGCKESRYCKAFVLKQKKAINQYMVDCFLKTYGDIDDLAIDKIKELANPNIYYDKVVSIENGESITYDIHVPWDNEYCANGFFSHNSKIRGSRFYLVCLDELAQIPGQIIDMVLRPMGAATLNPMVNVRRLEKQRRLIELGLATEDDFDDSMVNKMIMTSSGYYKFNHMWKRMKDHWGMMDKEGKSSQYAVWQIPYWDLPEGFLDRNNISEAKRIMSSAEFKIEYEAEMISDSEGFFKASLLESCTDGSNYSIELKGKTADQYVIGIDPNQGGNASCGVVVIKIGSVKHVVNVLELKRLATQDLTKVIQTLCEDYNIIRIFMDSRGGGNALRDLLEDGYGGIEPIIDITNLEHKHVEGRHILDMVDFNPRWIANANFTTKALLEDKKLLFPEPPQTISDLEGKLYDNINTLKSQMLNIVVTQTGVGNLHFDTPKKNQNKDLYSAMILAAYGVREMEKEFEEEVTILHNSGGLVRERKPGAVFTEVSKAVSIPAQSKQSMALLGGKRRTKVKKN